VTRVSRAQVPGLVVAAAALRQTTRAPTRLAQQAGPGAPAAPTGAEGGRRASR